MWGRQYSVPGIKLRAEFCKVTAQRANAISLRSCRVLTRQILNTSLVPVTSRQAINISDSVFSRWGVVAGILDAIITQDDRTDHTSIAALKAQYAAEKKTCHDCRQQIVRYFDLSVERNLGQLKLWQPGTQSLDLSSIYITDPFPGERKLLWIRYCRACDGERKTLKLTISEDGKLTIPNPDLSLDFPEIEATGELTHMTIAKEEFVACVLNSPLLSESLCKLSSWDCGSTDQNMVDTNKVCKSQPIVLDVNITDSTDKTADAELDDAFNIRQRVLFEVWDSDRMPALKIGKGAVGMSDFLGEAWLPPLGSLKNHMTAYVLPLVPAPHAGSGEAHRPDPRKDLDDRKAAEISGELFVEASWEFPAPPGTVPALPGTTASSGKGEGKGLEGLHDRVQKEALQQTGLLKLKVLRGHSLRRSDARKLSDPYVVAYIRNDSYTDPGEGWRKKHHMGGIQGAPEEILRTTVCKQTLNPEWEKPAEKLVAPTVSLPIQTGSFEKKLLESKSKWYDVQITKHQREEHKQMQDLKVIGEHDEVKVGFGDAGNPKQGHGVDTYLGDTIYEFKNKLREAVKDMAKRSRDPKEQEVYNSVKMNSNHYVMVFCPSDNLRQKKALGGHEFYRHWKMEYDDPGAWAPLDPLRTFNHYVMTHGFGMSSRDGKKNPLQLRVSFGSEDYARRNHRFRTFKKENADMDLRLEERNESKTCFGFAKYLHKEDGDSVEWRPVVVTRPDDYGEASRRYQVEWVYTLSCKGGALELIDEDKVVLAPANPKIRGAGSLEHMEILMQAKRLHDGSADGKVLPMDDKAITAELNRILMAKYERTRKAEEDRGVKEARPKPVPISEMDVKYFLKSRNVEAEAAGLDSSDPFGLGPGAGPLALSGSRA